MFHSYTISHAHRVGGMYASRVIVGKHISQRYDVGVAGPNVWPSKSAAGLNYYGLCRH